MTDSRIPFGGGGFASFGGEWGHSVEDLTKDILHAQSFSSSERKQKNHMVDKGQNAEKLE